MPGIVMPVPIVSHSAEISSGGALGPGCSNGLE